MTRQTNPQDVGFEEAKSKTVMDTQFGIRTSGSGLGLQVTAQTSDSEKTQPYKGPRPFNARQRRPKGVRSFAGFFKALGIGKASTKKYKKENSRKEGKEAVGSTIQNKFRAEARKIWESTKAAGLFTDGDEQEVIDRIAKDLEQDTRNEGVLNI